MRPLNIDEIEGVSGGVTFDEYMTENFLYYLNLIGNHGTSSEQPTPPPWWGDCGSAEYRGYITNGGLGTTCPPE